MPTEQPTLEQEENTSDAPIPGQVVDSQLKFYNLKKDPNYVHPNLVSKYPPSVVYKQLFGYLRPYLWRVIAALLITIPAGVLEGAPLFFAKPFLDSLVAHSEPVIRYAGFSLVISSWMIALAIVSMSALQGVLNYFSIYLSGWLGSKVMITIQQDLFRKLQTFDIRYFDKTSTGVVIQRFFRDAEALQAGMINNTRQVLTRGIFSVVLMSVLFTLSWKLALLALAIMICIMLPARHVRGAIKKISEGTLASSGDLLSFYTDTVGGSRVIYGYNLQGSRYDKFKGLQRNFLHKKIKRLQLQGWLTSSMQLIASVGIAIVVMWGSQMVFQKELDATAFLTFMGTMIALYNPLKNVGDAVLGSTTSFLASQRIFMMLGAKMVITDRENAQPLKNVDSCIKFENVSFFYDYEKMHRLVLRDINLQFNKGEMVALVGPSGGGKTTLVNLIPRFYEVVEGSIKIDDTDIRDITQESLRENISIVFQDNFLFNTTIYDNLIIGKPDATEEEIFVALEKAYLLDFVNSLSEGIHTEIGERGILMSGGQRQRLAIARAILKNSPIVILDEATSALDNFSEAMVHKAMESLIENRTVIIIAHRLSTIRNADRILLIDEGEVKEQGTHEELIKQNGQYAAMYNIQFDGKNVSPLLKQASSLTGDEFHDEPELIAEAIEI